MSISRIFRNDQLEVVQAKPMKCGARPRNQNHTHSRLRCGFQLCCEQANPACSQLKHSPASREGSRQSCSVSLCYIKNPTWEKSSWRSVKRRGKSNRLEFLPSCTSLQSDLLKDEGKLEFIFMEKIAEKHLLYSIGTKARTPTKCFVLCVFK